MIQSRIKTYREKRGLTQSQLADRLGICQSAVAKWETGGFTPSTANLLALAEALGCSIDALYGREPPTGEAS